MWEQAMGQACVLTFCVQHPSDFTLGNKKPGGRSMKRGEKRRESRDGKYL